MQFQFHKVRLKEEETWAQEQADTFQFHKVRLKDQYQQINKLPNIVSIP